jgi:hypothetical protein
MEFNELRFIFMSLKIPREKSDEGGVPGDKYDVVSSTNTYVLEKIGFLINLFCLWVKFQAK